MAMTVPVAKVAAGGVEDAGGRTVMTTVSPTLSRLAASRLLLAVMRVPPLLQKASKGSGVGVMVVPAFVSSKNNIEPPGLIGVRLPSFQSAMVSPLAS